VNPGGDLLRLAAEKATVVIGSRYPRPVPGDPEQSARAKEELSSADASLAKMRRSGGRALWIDTDVSRPESVGALLRETRNRFGRSTSW
jgi:NAD(P)-dependent dehydrogenase (short-subunit alcohol dehydrogenase family)